MDPLIILLIFIFLFCREKACDNKEFSRENSKPRFENDQLSQTISLSKIAHQIWCDHSFSQRTFSQTPLLPFLKNSVPPFMKGEFGLCCLCCFFRTKELYFSLVLFRVCMFQTSHWNVKAVLCTSTFYLKYSF